MAHKSISYQSLPFNNKLAAHKQKSLSYTDIKPKAVDQIKVKGMQIRINSQLTSQSKCSEFGAARKLKKRFFIQLPTYSISYRKGDEFSIIHEKSAILSRKFNIKPHPAFDKPGPRSVTVVEQRSIKNAKYLKIIHVMQKEICCVIKHCRTPVCSKQIYKSRLWELMNKKLQ